MKILTVLILLVVTTTASACTPVGVNVPPMENIAIIFVHTPCGPDPVDVLDSVSGTLRHTPLGGGESIILPFPLTDNELNSIYQKALEIGLFDYPNEFIVPEDQITGRTFPVSHYQLKISAGELSNTVAWTGGITTTPNYAESAKLDELAGLILRIMFSRSVLRELANSEMACA
jgi:hypothetical protein